jgi:hypothetical protein
MRASLENQRLLSMGVAICAAVLLVQVPVALADAQGSDGSIGYGKLGSLLGKGKAGPDIAAFSVAMGKGKGRGLEYPPAPTDWSAGVCTGCAGGPAGRRRGAVGNLVTSCWAVAGLPDMQYAARGQLIQLSPAAHQTPFTAERSYLADVRCGGLALPAAAPPPRLSFAESNTLAYPHHLIRPNPCSPGTLSACPL